MTPWTTADRLTIEKRIEDVWAYRKKIEVAVLTAQGPSVFSRIPVEHEAIWSRVLEIEDAIDQCMPVQNVMGALDEYKDLFTTLGRSYALPRTSKKNRKKPNAKR